MIFKMRKPQDNEIVTLFFLPDKSVFDKFRRMTELAEYRANGYMCSGFTCVDKETYLNARLNETVKDFCENEEYRRDVLDRHSRGLLSETVFFETMRLIDDYKWTCLKKLSMQVVTSLFKETVTKTGRKGVNQIKHITERSRITTSIISLKRIRNITI